MPNSKDTRISGRVFQRISESPSRNLPFSDFMEVALYDPEAGYYARPDRHRPGRKGDFFTSVSVGETFGFLLAHRLLRHWQETLDPGLPLTVVEQGGHDGQLACDVLRAIEEIAPEGLESVDYVLLEPREGIAPRLEAVLAGLLPPGARCRVARSVSEARAAQGVFLCNELLDAFPFRRLVRADDAWRELRVGADGRGGFRWEQAALDAALAPFAERLDRLAWPFPEGYATEVCPGLDPWAGEVAGLFERGAWWIVDYGHEEESYYAPHRREGTCRAYRGHQVVEDLLSDPGRTDLTAHVNFSHLQRAGEAAGLRWEGLCDQGRFLTEAARPWLLSLEGAAPSGKAAQRLRQFQTLTHPSMMGRQFSVATFSKGGRETA